MRYECYDCGEQYKENPFQCPNCDSRNIYICPKGKVEVVVQEERAEEEKYDEGKPMVGLMKKDFPKALLAVAGVTTFGVEKYRQPGSWRLVTDALNRYEDALGRHDLAMRYEDYDPESKHLHAAHRAWNALATLEMILEDLDDKKTT